MDQTLQRMAAKEGEEIKRTTKQRMARRHNKEGENHLGQESNRQKTMEDIDGGLHPAVDGQSLDEKDEILSQLNDLVGLTSSGFPHIVVSTETSQLFC